ncbi:conserved hypothetical protein [Rhodospirillaceae bacterium LM-1]|nr:conserved hypothetical protein [Rhodospirillaceae bacterium LM-1]
MPSKNSEPKIFGFTVFCDDIRTEADGKISYIGSYPSDMIIHGEFPAILPKFGFGIKLLIRTDVASKIKSNVPIKILMPGEDITSSSISFEFPSEELMSQANKSSPVSAKESGNDSHPYFQVNANLIVNSLSFKQAGRVCVRAVFGNEVVKLGSLGVQKAPTGVPESGDAVQT